MGTLTHFVDLHGALLAWQNFYLLAGGAAATLIGLMFVAVTFGASLVKVETAAITRSFLDPVFGHFAQVLSIACLATIPALGGIVLGALLLGSAALRSVHLVRVVRHMREAHRRHNDLELSDWMSGVVAPVVVYLLLAATAALLVLGLEAALSTLAAATLILLMNGLYGAWEIIVWIAYARARSETQG